MQATRYWVGGVLYIYGADTLAHHPTMLSANADEESFILHSTWLLHEMSNAIPPGPRTQK